MNVERIEALASHIETLPHTTLEDKSGFNMSSYIHSCGTPSCIAGWAVELFGTDAQRASQQNWLDEKFDTHGAAQELLGLSQSGSFHLFAPSYFSTKLLWSSITPAQAAGTLRHLASTGAVEWIR